LLYFSVGRRLPIAITRGGRFDRRSEALVRRLDRGDEVVAGKAKKEERSTQGRQPTLH
jgi:hypothetical protein